MNKIPNSQRKIHQNSNNMELNMKSACSFYFVIVNKSDNIE